ncbi:LOW QUALITY PROTEIN: leucine-rich PPR motif-containing protein, mitochondrial [Drosophila ficusphila]|uniref:LOW QUALITY PROTEIN: leucine-rich PPR motif-containing protein, mitochondrial n=1 Tax=Drosophila ficusphila TaxID=30025 RepID=UPI001C8AEA27|nr:LOW QUALITY PROTEIN: leucine-rich PPR motif-containing protein, mitochondrial [Drosophila ficusphila]
MASILRTGKLLRYFAGFTRNVVVNSVRENESSNLLNNAPCMCGQFQNGFATNAAAKAELSLDKQIRRLDQDVRRVGRISRRDLEEVLDEIRTHRTATSSQSLLVIRCCGNLVPEELPEVRTALVQEIWKTLNALNVPMDISHYNALLRVYLENEHGFAPTDFLAEIEAKGIEPNRVTYQRLIARYCQQGDIEGATRILEFMRAKSLPVNENVFNSLILGHSQANDLESAKGILGVMKQAGLEPSADTYTTLLCAFARHGDLAALKGTLAECEQKEIILLDKDLLDIVYTLTINGNGEHVDEILPKLRLSPGFNQDAVNVILRLVNKGHEDVGLKLLRVMPRSSRVNGEPVDVGAFFIRQMVKANRPVEKILSICKTLQSEGLNPKALTIATEAGLTNGVVNNALPLLQEMKNAGLPIRQHYFWPLICSAESNQVLEIVRRMQQEFSVFPNSETVRDYVIPNLKEKNWERVVTSLRDAGVPNSTAVTSAVYSALVTHQIADAAKIMEQNRAYYVPILFRQPLILALSHTNDYAAFIRCVRQIHEGMQLRQGKEEEVEAVEGAVAAPTERGTPDVVGAIVQEATTYFRRDRAATLEKILKGLVKQGLSISSAKATQLSEQLGSELTPQISELLGKLSSGELQPVPLKSTGKRTLDSLSIDELERFIVNVESKGENANNIKRQLLNACFRSQNLEKTLQVIDKLETEKFQIPIGIYAQLIDLYTHHKKSAEALETYGKLKAKDAAFQLDNYKAVRLADLLLQEEREEAAFKVLEDNKKDAPLNETEGSFNYVSTVWRILNSIAEAGQPEKLRKVFDALVAANYVVPTNVLLGPLIKVHLVKDDIPKAIEAFEEICQKHKSTPWKNELACRLIQKEDATNLQKLTDLSTGIHGEVNSLYDLVFSFVECGRVRQARKILETPGLRTRPQRISSACDRYKNEGLLQPLEGLIEATKDLGHIDRNKIYYTLLLSYDKADEAEKALGLWTKMQEEAVTPNDAFLLKLAEILKKKNMDVPFVVPETQKEQASRRNKPKEQVKTEATTETAKIAEQPKEKTPKKQQAKTETVKAAPAVKSVSPLSSFRKAIIANDVDAAISHKQNFQSGDKVSALDISRLIELLVRADRLTEATKYVDELLGDKLHPQPKIFKFYLNKIAAAGDLETLEKIGKQLNDEQKRLVSFDNRFCHANIVAGKAEQFLKHLTTEIDAAKNPEDAKKLAEKFPRGGAVGILDKHPELVPQYQSLAEKFAAHNQLGPMNVLWMHLISSGQEAASKEIWDKHLSNAPRLMFQRVLQTAREQQDEKLASTVISQLKNSKISEGAIGNAYSCLIDIQTTKGNSDKAMDVLANAIKDVSLENINRTALLRLKQAVEEKSQKFPYTIPEKRTKADDSSSSSSSSSSDDDVSPAIPETVPPKPDSKV